MAYKNKADQAAYIKKHYKRNLKIYKARAAVHNKKMRGDARQFVKSYLEQHPCVDCGETDIIVLDFDHVRGEKEGCISESIYKGWALKRIEAEIAKCEVRCANCHRRVTHKRRHENNN